MSGLPIGGGGAGGGGGSGGGGSGMGTDVNASLANAETSSFPQNLNAPTYFLFGSEGTFGDIGQTASPYQPANATSSAAKGAPAIASSSQGGLGGDATTGAASIGGGATVAGIPVWELAVIGLFGIGAFALAKKFW